MCTEFFPRGWRLYVEKKYIFIRWSRFQKVSGRARVCVFFLGSCLVTSRIGYRYTSEVSISEKGKIVIERKNLCTRWFNTYYVTPELTSGENECTLNGFTEKWWWKEEVGGGTEKWAGQNGKWAKKKWKGDRKSGDGKRKWKMSWKMGWTKWKMGKKELERWTENGNGKKLKMY